MVKRIKYISGDLFDNIPDGNVILPHVCNSIGAFGSGFVLPLASHFPVVKKEYLEWSRSGNDFKLGETQFVQVKENLVVANMIAQTLGGTRPLFYNHLVNCMETVYNYCDHQDLKPQIIAPLFGSKLAGGDFNFIEKLIEDCWLRRDIDVTICYLPQFLPDNWKPPVDTLHRSENGTS